MIRYTVKHGDLSVQSLTISSVSVSSILFVGDVKSIALSSIYETPPESTIVGVTVGVVPAVERGRED